VAELELNLGTSAATDADTAFVAAPTAAVTIPAANAGGPFVVAATWSAASASNTLSLLGSSAEQLG